MTAARSQDAGGEEDALRAIVDAYLPRHGSATKGAAASTPFGELVDLLNATQVRNNPVEVERE
jgi:hypothetical protein